MEYIYLIVLRVLFQLFSFCVLLMATAVVLLGLPFVPYSLVHSSCCSVFLFFPLPLPPSSCYCLPVSSSSCYSVFLFPPSSCYSVFLFPPSSCYSVFLFPRLPVILSSCYSFFLFPVFLLFCLLAPPSSCFSVFLFPIFPLFCLPVSQSSCYSVFLFLCLPVPRLPVILSSCTLSSLQCFSFRSSLCSVAIYTSLF